jgi:hypothetical protein
MQSLLTPLLAKHWTTDAVAFLLLLLWRHVFPLKQSTYSKW